MRFSSGPSRYSTSFAFARRFWYNAYDRPGRTDRAENRCLEEHIMKKLETTQAPSAIGPYSQGYEVNGLVFTSGQIPIDPASGGIPEGIAAQAAQSCKNVGAILAAAGTGFEQVVKTTCFLADMGDFAAFNEVYATYFVSKPARSCVAVKDLPKGVLCEIEAIAVK